MGLLDFTRQQAASGQPAAQGRVPAPQVGYTGRLPTGQISTATRVLPQATGTYQTPGKAPLPSLSAQLTGHDPSLYNMLSTGGDWQSWMHNGGPSVFGASMNKVTDSLGLPKFTDPLGIFKPKDSYGPLNTQHDASMDYGSYFDLYDDVASEWNTFSDTEKNRLFKGDPNNYAAWHWQNYGQKEGRNLASYVDNAQLDVAGRSSPRQGTWNGNIPTVGTLRRV